jgi:hypothetical protein
MRGLLQSLQAGPTVEDREEAGKALARQGDRGRDMLVQLVLSTDRSVRAGALAALVSGADCSSPFVTRALEDADASVNVAALKSMVTYHRRQNLPCLASAAADPRFDLQLREQIIYALPTDYESPPMDIGEVEDVLRILRGVLSDPQSPLYEPGWAVIKQMLAGRETSKPDIGNIAKERLAAGLTAKDSNLICALRSVRPALLSATPAMIEGLINAFGHESWEVRHCVDEVLATINLDLPRASNLLAKIMKAKFLTDGELNLVEKSIPRDLFARNWRKLAAVNTGGPRLRIYRIAMNRGLAHAEGLALFSNVLLGRMHELGKTPNTNDTQYTIIPAALSGLLAVGAEGHAVIGRILRGEQGISFVRSTVIVDLVELDHNVVASFEADLLAARRDSSAEVRSAIAHALPYVVRSSSLAAAMRPLFNDHDEQVLYKIADLIVGNGIATPPDFLAALSSADAQTIVNSARVSGISSASSLLVKLTDRLPPDFVEGELQQLLLDPRHSFDAPEAAASLGPVGAQALTAVLSSPQASRLFNGRLASAITKLKPVDRQPLVPVLNALRLAHPDTPALLGALTVASNGDPTVISVVVEDLLSDDADIRSAALDALPAQYFFSSHSQRYLASLIDQRVQAQVETYLGAVLEEVRPYTGPVPISYHGKAFPTFPWPPPPWSFKELVSRNMVGDDGSTLGQVADRLVAAVRLASPDYDYGVFDLPSGFVLLARLEHINPDGTPYPGRERWDQSPERPHSLSEYLLDLFFSPPGYFRIIALVVTSEEPLETQSNTELPSPNEGAKALPETVAKRPFTGHQVFALVYTFRRFDGGKMVPNYEGSPSGLTHLIAAGIWPALQATPARR